MSYSVQYGEFVKIALAEIARAVEVGDMRAELARPVVAICERDLIDIEGQE